ncbi:16S rRNA (adenine(1518)-N(6)/adenine(1519)-N(6))-dimethyltransferase RsmA [Carboxylicivirga sp. M1479]|uniref:16S rRNA (adenine(1518)-N(6)/adenine(1519)-N(6))- dimethyltransferase RsmA n=1 Tax=Carboxylicivirga sp. M1479 TaxID=2594476 RepID=UPI0011788D76|nr:16S rRNA (adenine(1518)-N(6)/adenine(1519)-N(6))-dimethyltransferase RsmA [Carboxylicivirga sp. M1479]TRX71268.1 16S rRNA (adenine(1518)-N(6)/adenine(1519)-N(6))-dimethyltransferase RsmA [Carboxylicivirga sp. M1479]
MVRAKKHLGQHFLTDLTVAQDIVTGLSNDNQQVMEIGPGTGVLTQYLVQRPDIDLNLIELDEESVEYLSAHYPELKGRIHFKDFLKLDLTDIYKTPFALIGNFPYNISGPIFFKVFEYRNQIPEVVGMLQKEVAERLASGPGTKKYGILSVLLQAFYNIEYLFTVGAEVFSPPPKVQSGVIRLTRNDVVALPCDEKLFVKVVKAIFHQRRKAIRNSLKAIPFNKEAIADHDFLTRRPEQMSVADFIELTQLIEANPM